MQNINTGLLQKFDPSIPLYVESKIVDILRTLLEVFITWKAVMNNDMKYIRSI